MTFSPPSFVLLEYSRYIFLFYLFLHTYLHIYLFIKYPNTPNIINSSLGCLFFQTINTYIYEKNIYLYEKTEKWLF